MLRKKRNRDSFLGHLKVGYKNKIHFCADQSRETVRFRINVVKLQNRYSHMCHAFKITMIMYFQKFHPKIIIISGESRSKRLPIQTENSSLSNLADFIILFTWKYSLWLVSIIRPATANNPQLDQENQNLRHFFKFFFYSPGLSTRGLILLPTVSIIIVS